MKKIYSTRIKSSWLAAIMALFIGVLLPVGQVYAADSIDYNTYCLEIDCSYYDPTSTGDTGGCSLALSGSDNEAKVWSFFIGQGLSPEQAAGIMGNMKAEAHFEPRLVEYGWPNSSGQISEPGQPSSLDDNVPPDVGPQGQPGYGLIQWTSPGRKQGLRDLATKQSLKGGDLGLQLTYIMQELTGSYKSVYTQLKSATTPEDAADIIMNGYERPGDPVGQKPVREAFAVDILAKYGSSDTSGSSGTPSTTTSTGGGSCNSDISGYLNPLRDIKNLSPARIDEGVDYVGDGPVYAIGNGKVIYANNNTGWPGGNFVSYTLSDGPAAGKVVYVAENCDVKVSVGQQVDANTELCQMHSTFPFIETGWGITQAEDLAAAYQNYKTSTVPDGSATNYGQNFDAFMQKLGAPAGTYDIPSQKGQQIGTPLPSDWPQW